MTAVAVLVVDEAVTRLDALDAISLVAQAPIDDAGTTRASVALSPTTRARIDIPKFGEAPPLAIDVESQTDEADARAAALTLADGLQRLGWRVAPAFPAPGR